MSGFRPRPGADRASRGAAVVLLLAAGMFWTGTLLAKHSRRGAWYALGFVLLSLITSFDALSLAFAALSLIVLATIWKDLK